jgi:hypothetical protein
MKALLRGTSIIFILASMGFLLVMPVIASGTEYSIQVGAFANNDNAVRLTSDMNKKGHPAFYREERLPDGHLWHKVYVGTYPSHRAAKQAAQKLIKKHAIPAKSFVRALTDTTPAHAAVREEAIQPTGEADAAVGAIIAEKQSEAVAAPAPEVKAPPPPEPPPMPEKKPVIAPPPPVQPPPISEAERQERDWQFMEQLSSLQQPLALSTPEKREKDWGLAAGYQFWYVDMAPRAVNSSLAAKGYLHGPKIEANWKKLALHLSALFTVNNLDGGENGHYSNGVSYYKTDKIRRSDIDFFVKYRFESEQKWFTVSPLLGLKYTKFTDMNAYFTSAAGQYTLTGSMDILGPAMGLELAFPLGNPKTTPVSMSVSAIGMYLRATGKHPGNWPAAGGAFGRTFDGADFSAWGWGGAADAHLNWNITDSLQFVAGGRYQGAQLSDTSPAGTSMNISNGLIGAYTNLNVMW